MNSDEKQMTEAESLQLITSMINKAKNRFNEMVFYTFFGAGSYLLAALFSLLQSISLIMSKTYYVWYRHGSN